MSNHTDEFFSRKARWIWSPAASHPLPGTFVLFRKTFFLKKIPACCRGRILADTQYRLFVNGCRIQDGPAPSDPRRPEVDPLDVTSYLRQGVNVVAVQVAYLGGIANGGGDNQWIGGAGGGLLMELAADTSRGLVATDASWRCQVDSAHPLWARRNYGRVLREQYDARMEACGWQGARFDDAAWPRAVMLPWQPNRPLVAAHVQENRLSLRSIPLMAEREVQPRTVVQHGRLQWRTGPDEFFQFANDRSAAALAATLSPTPAPASFPFVANPGRESDVLVTFDFGDEVAAYPCLELEAPAGTIVDLVFAEKPKTGGPIWLDPLRNSIRVICGRGRTVFMAFDYEALKYMQLVVRCASGRVTLHKVAARRRLYPFAGESDFASSDAAVNAVFKAGINTARNIMQDYMMDNVYRERGAYGPWGSASAYAFGDSRLNERCTRLLLQSRNAEGWIFDGWPGWVRLIEMTGVYLNTGATHCLVDVTFLQMILHYENYLFSGNRAELKAAHPVYAGYMRWLLDHCLPNGLLPVRPSMWHRTWVDHMGWGPIGRNIWPDDPQHLPLNLLLLYIFREIFPAMEKACGTRAVSARTLDAGRKIVRALRAEYWDEETGLFVINLPQVRRQKHPRLVHEIALALSLLLGLVPDEAIPANIRLLADYPKCLKKRVFLAHAAAGKRTVPVYVGIAHPPHARWRWQALAQHRRGDVIVRDITQRWGRMLSVKENNTIAEGWETDYGGPMCYGDNDPIGARCQGNYTVPEMFYRLILGLEPLEAGWKRFKVSPQLGNLSWAKGAVPTPAGQIRLHACRASDGCVECRLEHPQGTVPAPDNQVRMLKRPSTDGSGPTGIVPRCGA